MAVKQLPKLSELPEPPDRLVGDQERFDVLTFNSLKAQKKMVNDDLNKTFIPKLNEFAVDVNASVDAAAQSERNAAAAATTAGNKANEAASSATTAGTKAGEASKSAAAAKTSETNAAASKTAAAKSATDAQAAQRGAEAARDEAQDLANVGYASDAKAGLAKVDGKTMQADAGGMITAKDVAIGGDKTDLASDRGQIGNVPPVTITDFNTFTTSGRYFATWNRATAKNIPPDGTNGLVIVSKLQTANVVRQIVFRWGTAGTNDWQIFTRESTDANGVLLWSPWRWIVTDQSLGDGLRFSGGKLSVPEYVGATASAPGTSGLVPPAAARERESFLTGSGKYKPALSTSGGTITGELNIAAPAGGSEGGEITLINGTDGKYPAKIDTTRNLIRFFGGPSNPVSVDLETGRFVGNLTGKADTAGIADSALAFANGRRWVEVIYEGNPGWLIGSEKEELRPVNPSSLNVNYANSAGKADTAGIADNSLAFANGRRWVEVTYEGNPGWLIGSVKEELRPVNPSSLNVNYANSAGTANINLHDIRYYGSQDSITLPAGGTWLVWWVRNTTRVNGGMGTYAGGATVTPGQTNNYYCIRIA